MKYSTKMWMRGGAIILSFAAALTAYAGSSTYCFETRSFVLSAADCHKSTINPSSSVRITVLRTGSASSSSSAFLRKTSQPFITSTTSPRNDQTSVYTAWWRSASPGYSDNSNPVSTVPSIQSSLGSSSRAPNNRVIPRYAVPAGRCKKSVLRLFRPEQLFCGDDGFVLPGLMDGDCPVTACILRAGSSNTALGPLP